MWFYKRGKKIPNKCVKEKRKIIYFVNFQSLSAPICVYINFYTTVRLFPSDKICSNFNLLK